jgi:hypothetical protein
LLLLVALVYPTSHKASRSCFDVANLPDRRKPLSLHPGSSGFRG